MISSSANDISTQEKKATINPEHVILALDQLGFPELKEAVAAYWEQWKADQKGKARLKASTAGLSFTFVLFAQAILNSLASDIAQSKTLTAVFSGAQAKEENGSRTSRAVRGGAGILCNLYLLFILQLNPPRQ